MGGVAQTVIQLIFVEIPSVTATIVLINIGIAQFKLNAIYEDKKSKDEEENTASDQTEETQTSFEDPNAEDLESETEEINV